MGFRSFFHKIKIFFERDAEPILPYVSEEKSYGKYGEDEVVCMLRRELPFCKIKRNIVISTPEGDAEIDCLVFYQNKLFAIEVKRWKGCLRECENYFLQEKTDFWTNEIHKKYLKSPFKQLSRAIYLLRKQIPGKVWVNPIVFFEDDELESVSVFSNNVWFDGPQELLDYIHNQGKPSFEAEANTFFEKCVSADYLYDNRRERFLYCIVNRAALRFTTPQGVISADDIASIRILHHWTYDELYIQMPDGSKRFFTCENEEIEVNDNGCIKRYGLCNLDYIEFGRIWNC